MGVRKRRFELKCGAIIVQDDPLHEFHPKRASHNPRMFYRVTLSFEGSVSSRDIAGFFGNSLVEGTSCNVRDRYTVNFLTTRFVPNKGSAWRQVIGYLDHREEVMLSATTAVSVPQVVASTKEKPAARRLPRETRFGRPHQVKLALRHS